MEKLLTVKEFSTRTNKSEETIKRWIRSGKIPNAIKDSDKKGWRIPESNLSLEETSQDSDLAFIQTSQLSDSYHNDKELVNLAYQAVTMTHPTEEMLNELSNIGIKRTLELLLCLQQSPTKVRNVAGFLKKGIKENWGPASIPIKLPRNQSKRIYELTQQDYKERIAHEEKSYTPKVPFYNWLEE
jgi:hypothetical protein